MTNDVPEPIARLEDRRYQAMLAGDLQTLKELLDDDLIYIHSTALKDDRAAYLALMREGNLTYETARRSPPENVVVADDFVLLCGRIEMDITWYGKPKALKNVYILTWVKRAAGWRMLSWQSTGLA